MLGTPAYMAPEQVEGGPLTAAADTYALGVVMYEMVTGVQPFVGDTPLSVAYKRLKEAPASPRAHRADLDPKWEAAILRCLERDPAKRFASVGDVVRALTGQVGELSMPPCRPKPLPYSLGVGVVAVAILVGAVGYRLYRNKVGTRTAPALGGVRARPSVAVLGFKNLSGKPDEGWVSTALSEMLTTELAAGEKLRTVPGEEVARTKVSLSLADGETYARDTLARLRSNLGADYVVLGSYFDLGEASGGNVRLYLRVQSTETGETVAAVSETGTEAGGGRDDRGGSRSGSRLRCLKF